MINVFINLSLAQLPQQALWKSEWRADLNARSSERPGAEFKKWRGFFATGVSALFLPTRPAKMI
ncbi:hypothetical protein D6817_01995 [Candidatus Pacearchaeota archaeon]|nr:MAG: hypothetical protein D6817_01995 [Candidatus Pacearchaeota archaeon]